MDRAPFGFDGLNHAGQRFGGLGIGLEVTRRTTGGLDRGDGGGDGGIGRAPSDPGATRAGSTREIDAQGLADAAGTADYQIDAALPDPIVDRFG